MTDKLTEKLTDKLTEKLEAELLLEALYRKYGCDFRQYAQSSLMRRLNNVRLQAGAKSLSELIPLVLHDQAFANGMVQDILVTVTEMFRDPPFFAELRTKIVPILKTYPFVKIWLAGCATGEEAYSMAIVLQEEGFYDRVQIYATDMNERSLEIAGEGIYPAESLRSYTANYHASGGRSSFSDYYVANYRMAKFRDELKRNIVFSNYNLVTDHPFGEMHLIVCRNVLIYFNRELQAQVLGLFDASLVHRGLLCLGSKETLDFTPYASKYETLSPKWKIYRQRTQ
ncbi:CheR family methyltransferase [Cohnella fermenti]|uniref:Protein-glutamate O-methyltransferase CheR n=1 Tax=Cohnella fermenti TaxID=2565925 RepID=A0A4S4BR03_9BACL|nr:protein-glutamate O-methyltransferase CheR [Cohnella fermenti]THF76582.1 protein-glutamate O-methyltransferase CheR [Cohnella fermenti]